MIRLIAFDLDGTLAESKSAVDTEMATLLKRLMAVTRVAVISGGDWPQFQKQLLSNLTGGNFANLSLLPTCGAKFYESKSGWTQLYAENLADAEKAKIVDSIQRAIAQSGEKIEKTYGEQVEDRGTQITFSALGQQAPTSAKRTGTRNSRSGRRSRPSSTRCYPTSPSASAGRRRSTSLSPASTRPTASASLRDTLGVPIDHMLFVGDALFEGGNDYAAKEAGVRTIQVRDPDESKRVIEAVIAGLE